MRRGTQGARRLGAAIALAGGLVLGPTGVLVMAFDTYFAKGWAPTWSDMGHGNWATNPNYAGKVIAIYRSMVASATS